MKDLRNIIMDYLLAIPEMNKQLVIATLNPLKTEQQAKQMLNYLENTNEKRIDKILSASLQISKEN